MDMNRLIDRKFTMPLLIVLLLLSVLVGCQTGGAAPTAPVNEPVPTATSAPAEEAATATPAPAADSNTQPAAAGAKTFQLTQGTEARVAIDEVLMGQDKRVVGVTALVEGQITVDPANPSSTQISPIRIDASDLTTDSSRRNGAIQRFVLQSNQDAYRYITFTPTAIEGLPAAVTVGEPFQFSVTGDLTIRDVTLAQTFPMTVTATSENELVGSGAATILLADYQLSIPSVPSVAWVDEKVTLELAFVATAQ
jgi:polyisoprenoid-binding protein YceI